MSAFVIWDGSMAISKGKIENKDLLMRIINSPLTLLDPMVIEDINPYSIGHSTKQTILWSGRFYQAFEDNVFFIKRPDIREHFCDNRGTSIKDKHIRQALIDRFGKPGTVKNPNLIYGETGKREDKIAADVWQALALAVYWEDLHGRD